MKTHNQQPAPTEPTQTSFEAEFLRDAEVQLMLEKVSLASVPHPENHTQEPLKFLSTTTLRGQDIEIGKAAGAAYQEGTVLLDPKHGGTLFLSIGEDRTIVIDFSGTRERNVTQRFIGGMYGDNPQVGEPVTEKAGLNRTLPINASGYEFAKLVAKDEAPESREDYDSLVRQGAPDTEQYRELIFVARAQELMQAADHTPSAAA